MIFHVLTLFPEMIDETVSHSVIGRAINNEQIHVNSINIRDYANNKHKQVDDYPYGGGPGMVMQPGPIYDAYQALLSGKERKRVVFLTPQGKTFSQNMAKEFAKEEELVLLCGHYEGIDERVIEEIVTDEVSIGDYVLTGGELGAVVMIDAIARLVPGVLGSDDSSVDESFSNNLLEYPQYTRPKDFLGKSVPDILTSGHHANIDKWRREQSLIRTIQKRPDLIEKAALSVEEHRFIKSYIKNQT